MPNSTAEYWDVDGVSLQTFAQNIKSWGGSREGVPPLRGEDQLIPYMPGRRFVKKVPDSRTITLKGWVAGMEAVDTIVRRNMFWNSVPATTTSWSAIPGTGGTAALSVMPASGITPAGIVPYMRATWSVQGSSGSAGFLITASLPGGKAGDVRSLSVWSRMNQPLSATMLFRFRSGATPVGQLLPAYAVQTVNQWTEWRLDGAVATADWDSMQAYLLINNSNPVPAGTTMDLLVPTIEDTPRALGVFGPGTVPDTETLVTRTESGTSQTILVRLDYRSTRQAARNNWRALRRLLWTPRRQIALTRRWYDQNGVLQTATAMAQYAGGLEPDVDAGGHRMQFSVDLFLADPFFYGAEVTLQIPSGYQEKVILGDFASMKARLELTGPMGGPSMSWVDRVNSDIRYQEVNYVDVAAGTVATLDIENFKATEKTGSNNPVPTSTKVSHKYDKVWFAPDPGLIGMWPTWGSTGSMKYIYRPAWL
ncbi:minor tail protein [Arthrobacter phage DanielleIgnace]|nr:minor tail protein [Arthrobacter phage DanielleIgnace]